MVYLPHTQVHPQALVDTGIEVLKLRSVASNLVTRESYDQFDGIEGGVVNVRVKGSLPVREYEWGNDRSAPIVTDTVEDTIVQLQVEKSRNYSAVKLTDEQKVFDFDGAWGDLFDRQMDALVNYNEMKIVNRIQSAPFELVIPVDNSPANITTQAGLGRDVFFNAFVDAKRDLKKMRAPGTNWYALVGSEFAAEVQKSQKLVLNQGAGDNALAQATLGTIAGVTLVEDANIPDDACFIFSRDAHVFYNAAPPLPGSVPFASNASAGGFALSWLMDYDTSFLVDRSVYQTIVGYGNTLDLIELQDTNGRLHTGTEKFFTRGAKLVLGTTGAKAPGDGSADTAGGDPTSYLAMAFKGEKLSPEPTVTQAFPGVLEVPGVLTPEATEPDPAP